MSSHKVLWVDDDTNVLEAAARLFRGSPWTLIQATNVHEALAILGDQAIAVLIADQVLTESSGIELLDSARTLSPATVRILLTGRISQTVVQKAVNQAHVFRLIAKPWDNTQLLSEVQQAIERHRLKLTQENLLREVSLQNRQLENLTSGLENLVQERTLNAESSKNQAERQLSQVRDLVRFIQELANLNSVEELMGLMRKELKGFHELRPPVLAYVVADFKPRIVFFQGKQVIERQARRMWSARPRIRMNEYEDRTYLANEFSRPFAKVLALPLKRRVGSSDKADESPATLFFEHSLADDKVDQLIAFISERLQPMSIALDRILLEYHLKYTSMQWEQTFDGIKDPIAIVDVDYSVVRANRHFPVLTRHGRIFETHCHRVFSETERPCSGCPVEFALKTRQPQRGQIRRGDQYFDVYSYPIQLNHDSVTTNVINHYVDVTKARELNGRMIQNEKMAAIGHLAGHIAHELNNPLTGIRSLAQVLMAEVPKTGSLHDDILEVEKASERSQKIIENLLAFSRGGTDQKQERIALNDIVRRTLPMLKTAMREHRSEVNLEANDAQVTVEPHLMQQVVFNLVNNACQAMPDIGSISLTTQVEYDSRGDWCVLKVSDTGTGIPQEIIDSIFEPFFTTKEQGRGTGLGLSMSRSVIEKFGGEIEVASTVGQGSTFIVRLPCVKEGPV